MNNHHQCSRTETITSCLAKMFNEPTVSHTQYGGFRCRFPSAVPFFSLTKPKSFISLEVVWFLVFTPYLFLPFFGESRTISLYHIILKPSCHMNILCEVKLIPPSASRPTAAQRTCPLHKGMYFKNQTKPLHKQDTGNNWQWANGDVSKGIYGRQEHFTESLDTSTSHHP